MNTLPWLGLLLVLPVILILTALGWATRVPRRRGAMLAWSALAMVAALGCCQLGYSLPPKGQHLLWPQIAAAGMAFIGFVSVWGLGLLGTRERPRPAAASSGHG